MKVLFINNFYNVDYLNDTVFHGARSLLGSECVDSSHAWYMYADTMRDRAVPLYGNGFNIAGKLPNISVDRTHIEEKIQDRFFDLIVYGSVHRCMDYWESVSKSYDPNKIVFIDGEDELTIKTELLGKGTYFKRELQNNNIGEIRPISFGIPRSQILSNDSVEKTKILANLTYYEIGYLFNSEYEYNLEYQRSYFGLTRKKAGWDCYRHYEIIANGCLPVFYNLHECPQHTMTLWDKTLLREATEFFWNFRAHNSQDGRYTELRTACMNMLREKLSTEAVFTYILNSI